MDKTIKCPPANCHDYIPGDPLCRTWAELNRHYVLLGSSLKKAFKAKFGDQVAKTKTILLGMASRGDPKPHHRTKLGERLRSYTLASSECYDANFSAKIKDKAPSWFENAEAKKTQLLSMAKKISAAKPAPSHRLGQAMRSYMNPSHKCYDPDFSDKMIRLQPDWFVNTANLKKRKLLEIWRGKPKCTTSLWRALHNYTNKRSDTYDSEFDASIRGCCDWLENTSAKKKEAILRLAKSGGDKPSRRSPLGPSFGSYICKKADCYDEQFDQELRSLRPDWFVVADTSGPKKKLLIELAKSGGQKPKSRSKIGYSMQSYLSPSSACYDEEFLVAIKGLRPDWFSK